MLKKVSILFLIGSLGFAQPVGVLANTIGRTQSELAQIENSVDIETLEDAIEDIAVEDEPLLLDEEPPQEEAVEEQAPEDVVDESSLKQDTVEIDVTEENEEEPLDPIEEEQEAEEATAPAQSVEEVDDEEKPETTNEDIVTGTWGTVPWTWEEATKTITLEAGNAGTVTTAPWKTTGAGYTNVEKIIVNGVVVLPASSSYLFTAHNATGLLSLTHIINGTNFDTSRVTNLNFMFQNARSLKEVDVSNWDTSRVTWMNTMFQNASSLEEVDVSNWNTANVTSFQSMFSGASSLRKLDTSNWNTSRVTNMQLMFFNASGLKKIDFSNWDTSSVTNMSSMFSGASSLKELDVSSWDTSRVTNMSSMFQNTISLEKLDVSNFDTSSVRSIDNMFGSTWSLKELDVSNFDTSNVTSMVTMFQYSYRLEELDLSNWDTSRVTSMRSMFDGARSLEKLDVSSWDTSSVTNMGSMFNGASSLEELDLSNWNTLRVTINANTMFSATNSLHTLHLGPNTTFTHLAASARPTLPANVMPVEEYTGNWFYEKDSDGNTPTEYLTLTPTNFFHEYDGSKPGTYVWERKEGASVMVHYEDTEGNQLAEPEVLKCKVGLPYESQAKEILGWHVVETPENASGVFTEDPQEVVYVYDRNEGAPVTVHHEDTEGNQLTESEELIGKVGLPYESQAKEIPGWHVVETPENASEVFTEEAQEVVYVYDRNEGGPVTVRYEDSDGNQLAEPEVLNGKVGLPYESQAKEIVNCYVVEIPENVRGVFTEAPQEVTYIYAYDDEDDQSVEDGDTDGDDGSDTTDTEDENDSDADDDTDTEDENDSETDNDSDTANENGADNGGGQSKGDGDNQEKGIPDNNQSVESDKQLPNTGETSYHGVTLMGLVVVVGAVGAKLRKYRIN